MFLFVFFSLFLSLHYKYKVKTISEYKTDLERTYIFVTCGSPTCRIVEYFNFFLSFLENKLYLSSKVMFAHFLRIYGIIKNTILNTMIIT